MWYNGDVIRKDKEIPQQKVSRSEIVNALRDLKPGESLIISGDHLTDKTLNQIYSTASRLRLAIRTKRTSIGLRVWLKDSEKASIERESGVKGVELAEIVKRPDYYPPENGEPDLRTKEQKQRYLAEYFDGKAEAEPRIIMAEIDEVASMEETRTVVYELD